MNDLLRVTPHGLTAHSWICPTAPRAWSDVARASHILRLCAAGVVLREWATQGGRWISIVEGEIGIWDVEPEGCGLWAIESEEAREIVVCAVAMGTKIKGWDRAMARAWALALEVCGE